MSVKCKLCGQNFKLITNTHLRSKHNCEVKDYIKRFGNKGVGFPVAPCLFPKDSLRYIKWKESLKKRPPSWIKGYIKETHPSVRKISETMKNKKIDNFTGWRQKMREQGKWNYSILPKNGDTAELIGVVLGDGHIEKHPRTESLSILSNANNIGFIKRYASLLEKLFDKKPYIACRKSVNCTRIRIYQKEISQRLGIPHGNRRYIENSLPEWMWNNKEFLIRCLRGLYEAEGSFCVHKPTYTYKLLFSNRNVSLLEIVYRALRMLDFHPHKSKDKIQISRKAEVYRCKELIDFRNYSVLP